jgi:hypothetical protein
VLAAASASLGRGIRVKPYEGHYFNTMVNVPNRGPFEARIAEQALKFAIIYHVFAHTEIEQAGLAPMG